MTTMTRRGRGQGAGGKHGGERRTIDPRVRLAFHEAGELFRLLQDWPEGQRQIGAASAAIIKTLRAGGQVFFFGNGGSASESQHLAAELVGRFKEDRRPLAAIALTDNIASLTAIGNDYSYAQVFSRQIEGLGKRGDVAVGLSTSGRSPNVIAALAAAHRRGLFTVGLTAGEGGTMPGVCDLCIRVPSRTTARIQEAHLLIGHTICELVDAAFLASPHDD